MRHLIIAAALAGCAGAAPGPAPAGDGGVEQITYETTACHGRCPVYRLSVEASGRGLFDGQRFTAAAGERAFTASPAQVRAFFDRLAPYRPAADVRYDGPERCRTMATDLPSVEVTWYAGGEGRTLTLSYGCDMDRHRALADALRHAPDALPIAALIGPR
jgi:hypothetical protein